VHRPLNQPENLVNFDLDVLNLFNQTLTPEAEQALGPMEDGEREVVSLPFFLEQQIFRDGDDVLSVTSIWTRSQMPGFSDCDHVRNVFVSAQRIGAGALRAHDGGTFLRVQVGQNLAVDVLHPVQLARLAIEAFDFIDLDFGRDDPFPLHTAMLREDVDDSRAPDCAIAERGGTHHIGVVFVKDAVGEFGKLLGAALNLVIATAGQKEWAGLVLGNLGSDGVDGGLADVVTDSVFECVLHRSNLGIRQPIQPHDRKVPVQAGRHKVLRDARALMFVQKIDDAGDSSRNVGIVE